MTIEELREEVEFWRRDAVARAWAAAVAYEATKGTGARERRANIFVNQLSPALHALRDADAKQWHMACEACGKALRTGQQVHYFDDAGDIHVDCADPSGAPADEHSHPYDDGFSPDQMAKMLAYARSIQS